MRTTTPKPPGAVLLAASLLTTALAGQFRAPHRVHIGSSLRLSGPTGSAAKHFLDVQALGTAAAGYRTNGCTGVCVDHLLGHIWVTARQDGANPNRPHQLLEFYWDPKANSGRGDWHTEVYDQPAALTASSNWGLRDLCAGSGATRRFIYGGAERKATNDTVFAFDVTKRPNSTRSVGWTSSADWRTTGVDPGIDTIRGLAYHAARGTMFTVTFNSRIAEFRRDGSQVQAWQPSRNFDTYGLAYDPLRQTLLATGQSGSAYPGVANAMVCYEIDPAVPGGGSAKETGVLFLAADRTIPASRIGGFSGGCHLHIERRTVDSTVNGQTNVIDVPVLTWLHQASSDTITQQYGRVEHLPYLPVQGQALPRNTGGIAGTAGDTAFLGNGNFQVTLRGSRAGLALLVASGAAHSLWTPFGAVLVDPAANAGFLWIAPQAVTGGRAALTIPIPTASSLAGAVAYFQWVEANGSLSSAVGVQVVQ